MCISHTSILVSVIFVILGCGNLSGANWPNQQAGKNGLLNEHQSRAVQLGRGIIGKIHRRKPSRKIIRTPQQSKQVSHATIDKNRAHRKQIKSGISFAPQIPLLTSRTVYRNHLRDISNTRFVRTLNNQRRVPASTFVVTDPGDDSDSDLSDGVLDPPTLRAAIENAELTGAADEIIFSGVSAINIQSQLPAILNPLTIDGSIGTSGKVQVVGSNFVQGGLAVFANFCVIQHLSVSGFSTVGISLQSDGNLIDDCEVASITNAGAGISISAGQNNVVQNCTITTIAGDGIEIISGSDHNLISENLIGTADGITSSANFGNGILIETSYNTIEFNTISGNTSDGVLIRSDGAFGNLIQVNFIGTTSIGNAILGNGQKGIDIHFGQHDTVRSNIISGNLEEGIGISSDVQNVLIEGNYIGTDLGGNSNLGNTYSGINNSGQNILINGNIIGGNHGSGIQLGWDADNCYIFSNILGMNIDGTDSIPNHSSGVYITGTNNFIGGAGDSLNFIAGNYGAGVYMTYSHASGNRVRNNIIGLDDAGQNAFPNYNGVAIDWGTGNFIEDNVLSGNAHNGVNLYGYTASQNRVTGNLIGTDPTGLESVPNGNNGVAIWSAPENTIGVPGETFSNLISGNVYDGVVISGDSAYGNVVQNNFIGTDSTGVHELANGDAGVYLYNTNHNQIGTTEFGGGNTISGNLLHGIYMNGAEARNNMIQGNFIGTDKDGLTVLPNEEDGIFIDSLANHNLIGGDTDFAGNIVSGNLYSGVHIDSACTKNIVQGNTIGLDITGTTALGNLVGIYVHKSDSTQIGGTTESTRNFISGNDAEGILLYGEGTEENQIQGNFIGLDHFGSSGVGNLSSGIWLFRSKHNSIGGSEPGSRNFISGNFDEGILFSEADSNTIENNIIGLDFQQSGVITNHASGIQLDSSKYNMIGGETASSGNVISGNEENGIVFSGHAESNTVYHNFIGTDSSGMNPFSNGMDGIRITRSFANIIGDTAKANIIAFNTDNGISILNGDRNEIRGNQIYSNDLLGIDLANDGVTINDSTEMDADSGPNRQQNYPRLTTAYNGVQLTVNAELESMPNREFRIDFYTNDSCDASGFGEGKNFLGSDYITTGSNGLQIFTSVLPAVPVGKFITATATDDSGNTSEFARCKTVIEMGPSADLELQMSASVDTVTQSDSLGYSIVVINHGPFIATDVNVTDTIPKELEYSSSTTDHGAISIHDSLFTCTIDSLASMDTVRITLNVVADSIGSVENIAVVNANETDHVPQNNRDFVTVFIRQITLIPDDEHGIALPDHYALSQNYPNPFNPTTTIKYSLPEHARVRIDIYSITGRWISSLLNAEQSAGYHSLILNGNDLASGIYFYRITANDYQAVKKMVLLK